MARDAALLASVAAGAAPVLRLYAWQPVCLSLGRFQRSTDLRRAALADAGIAVVRRPSGGRAILHAAELTYALVAPCAGWLAAGVRESYRVISAVLLLALQHLGVAAEAAPALPRSAVRQAPAACFARAGDYELVWRGRKLVGSAQVRQEGALLQHGSILLSSHAAQIDALLQPLAAAQAGSMVALDEILGQAPSWELLAAALQQAFTSQWGLQFTPGSLSAQEQALASQLRATQYATAEWTWQR